MKPLRLAQIGSGWISTVHMDSYRMIANKVGGLEVVALATVEEEQGRQFCKQYKIPEMVTNYRDLLKRNDIDVCTVAVPNYLHAPIAKDVLEAGKHVIVEKPLAVNLEEAEQLIQLADSKGLIIGYAEELCYVPKFSRMKQIAEMGGIGQLYMVKQCEKHAGPYSPWFWKRAEAGGGILMDMGCHAIEFCRWAMGKKKVTAVTAHMATYLHKDVTDLEDHVILTMEFENGGIAQVESSWALKGGMSSTAEMYGTEGVLYGDLLDGMGLRCYSENGYFPMPDNKALMGGPDSAGWSHPDYDWLWNNGYPQEFEDFFQCIREGYTPVESGQDGMDVLEIMLAGYHSAGMKKTVKLPFRPSHIQRPVDLWLNPRRDL